jgi:TonB family protein
MRKPKLIAVLLICLASSSLFAATNEAIYLGIDAKGVRHESKESAANVPWIRDVVHAERPRPRITSPSGRWYEGVGIFRLRIDAATGATREVTIVRSTGHVVFDRSALLALKVWRWKAETWTQVDVAIAFHQGGGTLFFPRYTTLPIRR